MTTISLRRRVGARVSSADVTSRRRHQFTLTPDGVRSFQLRAIALLVLLSTIGQLAIRFVDVPGLRLGAFAVFVDGEQTLPALYSTLILLACAGLAAAIGWLFEPPTDRMAWRLLAVLLAGAGFDEYAALHERTIEPLRDVLAISSGPLYYAWIIPGAGVVMVLAVLFSGFLRRLPSDTRRAYVVAGALFVLGAIGLEGLSGGYVSGSIGAMGPGLDPDAARNSLTYLALTTVEETLEMIGAAVFLTATVTHLGVQLERRLVVGTTPAEIRLDEQAA